MILNENHTFTIAAADQPSHPAKLICSRCADSLPSGAIRTVSAYWNQVEFRYCDRCDQKAEKA